MHFQDPEQHLPRTWTPTSWHGREHLLSATSALKVKVTPDYHNRSYERFMGQMSSCLSEVMVKDFQKKPTGGASGHQNSGVSLSWKQAIEENSACASRYNDSFNHVIHLCQ